MDDRLATYLRILCLPRGDGGWRVWLPTGERGDSFALPDDATRDAYLERAAHSFRPSLLGENQLGLAFMIILLDPRPSAHGLLFMLLGLLTLCGLGTWSAISSMREASRAAKLRAWLQDAGAVIDDVKGDAWIAQLRRRHTLAATRPAWVLAVESAAGLAVAATTLSWMVDAADWSDYVLSLLGVGAATLILWLNLFQWRHWRALGRGGLSWLARA